MILTGRWKGANVAVKVIHHQGAGHSSNLAVAREKMIGLASLHPNLVGNLSLLSYQEFLSSSLYAAVEIKHVCLSQTVQP